MKRKFVNLLVIISILIFSNASLLNANKRFNTKDAIYYWFSANQVEEGLVIAEKKSNFTVEEEVLSILVFLSRGHFHRAERIINFFANWEKEMSDRKEFKGFFRYYQTNGDSLSSEILASTQLWLLLAINEYTIKTGSKKFLPLANSLAEVILGMEGPEHGIASGYWGETPLAYFNSADNIMACHVFPNLWKWSDVAEYRFKAWKTYFFLRKFLWDPEEKNFRRRIYSDDYDITDALWSTLILGKDYKGWVSFPDPTDYYNKILRALVYQMYNEKTKSREILSSLEKSIIWSKDILGAAGLPVLEGGKEIDIFTTAWYILALENENPLKRDAGFWENKVIFPPAERQFLGDDFEMGSLQTLLAYPTELVDTERCKIIIDWENKDRKSGKGALRIFFSPVPESTSAYAIVTRPFLEPQDFSTFSTVSLWLKAATTTRIFQRQLKVNIGFVDADEELWISPELSIIGQKGFVNKFPIPVNWKRYKSSRGNNVFDVEHVRAMKILINQPADTPWQIYIDDLKLQ